MSAILAPSAAPKWARKVWADPSFIYLEVPCTNGGPPLIQKYEKCDGGLAKALTLICLAFHQEAPKPGSYVIAPNPLTKGPGINNFSGEQRAKARDVLKKLKII